MATSFAGKNVMMQAHAQYRGPLTAIARRLKADGASIHLYVSNADQISFYEKRNDGLYTSITSADVLYPACREVAPPMAEVVAKAREVEEAIGTTINELAVSDRHLGRGFALGGFGHPRSQMSEGTDYRSMLHAFTRSHAFWLREIEDKAPALFLNADKMACTIMRKRKAPVRIMAGSRYKNYFYWARDEFFHTPRVGEKLDATQSGPAVEMDVPYGDHLEWRKHFLQQASTKNFVRSVGYFSARRAWWHYKGYSKAKGYRLSGEIAYAHALWRDSRKMNTVTQPLSSLKGERFAFFPLHMEPETALQQLSPECFSQLSVIASIARDLPAGVRLAVKETASAIGRRPPAFYDQIREFKNVVLLDLQEFGLDVVKQCDLVFTITGTAGFEGAVFGKPVISFGRHNIYNCVPHVQLVTDFGNMKEPIRKALDPNFDSDKAKRDGERFLAAVIATSFDLGGYTSRKPDVVVESAMDKAYRFLLEDLAA